MVLMQLRDVLVAAAPLAMRAALVFLLLIGPVTWLARRLGWVDRPGHRKMHVGAVPLAGGTGIVLTLLVLCTWAAVAPEGLGLDRAALAPLGQPWVSSLAGGVLLVFVIALVDDRTPLRPRWRFIAQAAAAAIAIAGGTAIGSLGELLWAAELVLPPWFAAPFTVFALCGVANALNMSDGADGLAGGLALVALGWFAVVLALLADAHAEAGALLPLVVVLAGALAGFLLLNLRAPWRRRAAIFMGDSGSMTIGFVLGWLAVRSTNAFGEAGLPPVVALWLLTVPLFDTVSCMLRRIGAGSSPFAPDRRHLHHLLPATGLSVRRSVVYILAAALALGGLGIIGWRSGLADWAMFWTWLALFGTYHFAALRFWAGRRLEPVEGLAALRA